MAKTERFFDTGIDFPLAMRLSTLRSKYLTSPKSTATNGEIAALMLSEMERGLEENPDSGELALQIFLFSVGRILMIQGGSSRAGEFAALCKRSSGQSGETPLDFLAFDQLQPLYNALKAKKARFAELGGEPVRGEGLSPKFAQLFSAAQAAVQNFSNRLPAQNTVSASQLAQYSRAFSAQKARLRALVSEFTEAQAGEINQISAEHTQIIGEVSLWLRILSGEVEALRGSYASNPLKLISAFVLYVNPGFEPNCEASLLALIAPITTDPAIRSVAASLDSPESPAVFFAETKPLTAPWSSFHLSELHRPLSSSTPDFQSYLEYLILLQVDFWVFWGYYSGPYDLDQRVNEPLLLAAVCSNLHDEKVLDFLSTRGKSSVIGLAISETLSPARAGLLSTSQLLRLLPHAKTPLQIDRLNSSILRSNCPTSEKPDRNSPASKANSPASVGRTYRVLELRNRVFGPENVGEALAEASDLIKNPLFIADALSLETCRLLLVILDKVERLSPDHCSSLERSLRSIAAVLVGKTEDLEVVSKALWKVEALRVAARYKSNAR